MADFQENIEEDPLFLSPDSVKKMLIRDEKLFEEENKFFFVESISPHVSSRKRSVVKEKKIYLSEYREVRNLRASGARLDGIAYCMNTKSDGRTTIFKILLYNLGLRAINVKAKLNLYDTVYDALTDIRVDPLTMTLGESGYQTLKVAFNSLREIDDSKGFGNISIQYSDVDTGEEISRCDFLNFNSSPSHLQYRIPFEEFTERSEWILEPPIITLTEKNKTGRLVLRNYTNTELKFKLDWQSAFLSVSPISGVLPGNGEMGLRVTLPRKIKFGESEIRVFCKKEEKTAKVKIFRSTRISS